VVASTGIDLVVLRVEAVDGLTPMSADSNAAIRAGLAVRSAEAGAPRPVEPPNEGLASEH
jgi:hypothetical protein